MEINPHLASEEVQEKDDGNLKDTDQVKQPKHWKNEIHRQNEEYYLQKGLLLRQTEVIQSKKPFGEYSISAHIFIGLTIRLIDLGERSKSLPSDERCNFVCVSVCHGPAR